MNDKLVFYVNFLFTVDPSLKDMLRNFILHFINVFQIKYKSFWWKFKLKYLLLLAFELANQVLGYLSGGSLEKDSVVQFKCRSE